MIFKIKSLFIVGLAPFLFSCSNSGSISYKDFQEKVLEISSDSKIDQNEYKNLVKIIEESEETWAQDLLLESKKVNNLKLVSLIAEVAQEKNITISQNDIWQPDDTDGKPYSAHLMIENSASMDGYVSNATDFEASIFTILSNLKSNQNISLVDYGFVDSSVSSMYRIENINQIKEFTDKLEPVFLKEQSNNRSSSDIAQVISLAMQKQNSQKGDVAILLSDFIFSPPNNDNASNYLSTQGAYLQGFISNKINENNGNLAVWIVKLSSNFDGVYFDKNNKPHKINTNRPYYIWFFGNKNQIQQLSTSLDIKSLPNYKDDAKFVSSERPEQLNFSILTTTLIGDSPTANFNVENALKNNMISNAQTVKNGDGNHKFVFEVAIDLNNVFGKNKPEYYLDSNHYDTNNELFKVTNVRVAKPSDQKKIQSATHVLTLEFTGSNKNAQKIPKTKLKVNINQNLPEWVKTSSTNDDKEISSNPNLKDKTFGLYELINPIFQAFYAKNSTIGYIDISIEP